MNEQKKWRYIEGAEDDPICANDWVPMPTEVAAQPASPVAECKHEWMGATNHGLLRRCAHCPAIEWGLNKQVYLPASTGKPYD